MLKPKVAIVGAGNVGIRYAYCAIIKGLTRSIVIVDIDKKRAEGEAMDLSHGMPYVSPVEIYAGGYPDVKGSDLIVITAGRKQRLGQTRLALAKDNVEIFKDIIPRINRYAPGAIILVVTNPVDVLSYAAYKISQKSHHKIIGSGTVLDSARLRFLISKHCNIDARSIHAYILGEHGDSEFPVWSRAMIGGVLFNDYCPTCNKCEHRKMLPSIFEEVRGSAYKIIERKAETSYGIGLALARITEAILKDENSILPVSCFVEDFYGINDVYMGLPAVVNKSGASKRIAITLNKEEQKLLRASADKIKSVIKEAGL